MLDRILRRVGWGLAKYLPMPVWRLMPVRWQAWALQQFIDLFFLQHGCEFAQMVVQVQVRPVGELQ